MKTHRTLSFLSLMTVVSVALTTPLMVHGQARVSDAASLGLPRVKGRIAAHSLSSNRFQSEDLAADAAQGTRRSQRGRLDVLELSAAASFSRPLRAGRNDLSFLSFGLQGSLGTVVDVGGVKIGVTESAMVNKDYAQVMVRSGDEEWMPSGINIPFRKFDGALMAMLPVITIRLDPASGVFDLYSGTRLARSGIPYTADSGRRQIVVTAGSEGAWLTGLVQSDDNPLYVDANANGVDDDFEQAHLGKLLDADATKADRMDLLKAWRKMERVLPPPAMFVPRPRPDAVE